MSVWRRILKRQAAKVLSCTNLTSLIGLYVCNRKEIGQCLSEGSGVHTVVWDFGASPYALGDILTWSVRSCVDAVNAGKEAVDVCVIASSEKPSNRHQRYIHAANYPRFFLEMMPAFYTNPMLRNLHFYSDRRSFKAYLALNYVQRQSAVPDPSVYVRNLLNQDASQDYSHRPINAFNTTHGRVPQLRSPLGNDGWAGGFLRNYRLGTFFVVLHMRCRGRDTSSPGGAALHRDADPDIWLEFLREMDSRYPEVMFLVIGRPTEWPTELHRLRNVIAVKALGFGLAEELALIRECDMFMGSNSGPAVMAEFGPKPYLIFEVPENAKHSARLWDVPVNTESLPFAAANQAIKWGEVTTEYLLCSFEELYRQLDR